MCQVDKKQDRIAKDVDQVGGGIYPHACARAQSCPTLCYPLDCSLQASLHSLGNSTGVGCHFLLQEIFRTYPIRYQNVPGSYNY